jgi:hypothetical protein
MYNRGKILKCLASARTLIIIALSFDYASIYATAIIWNREIEYFFVLGFIVNFLAGVIIVNLRKALGYTLLSLFLGATLAVLMIITLPGINVNVALSVTLNRFSLNTIISIIVYVLGLLLGCFVGDAFALADEGL